jgi:predicted acetyltransferase
MTVTVRPVQPDEIPAWTRSVNIPFLSPTDGDGREDADRWRRHLATGRVWAAVDGDRFVGNCTTLSRQVTLPSAPAQPCPAAPLAAVTAVGVHPTHRRRGILRALMEHMLDDARARGEAVAGLVASEAVIYGRYGFGMATRSAQYVIDTRHGAFRRPAPAIDIRLLDAADAAKALPGLFERASSHQPGQVDRPEAVWKDIFADRPERRRGMSANFYAVTDDGYATYRAQEVEEAGRDWARLRVRDLVATSPDVEAALWRFVLDIDLVREVVASPRPVEEPLLHRLADPRELRTTSVTDFLWLRVLDVAAAFAGRGYRTVGRVVLDVAPAPAAGTHPDPAVGRWVIEGGPDGASCRPATPADATDLCVGMAVLGSLLAGALRPSVLAAAGLIDEERPRALDTADALFASRPQAFSATGF